MSDVPTGGELLAQMAAEQTLADIMQYRMQVELEKQRRKAELDKITAEFMAEQEKKMWYGDDQVPFEPVPVISETPEKAAEKLTVFESSLVLTHSKHTKKLREDVVEIHNADGSWESRWGTYLNYTINGKDWFWLNTASPTSMERMHTYTAEYPWIREEIYQRIEYVKT